jgi:hypothetical protein
LRLEQLELLVRDPDNAITMATNNLTIATAATRIQGGDHPPPNLSPLSETSTDPGLTRKSLTPLEIIFQAFGGGHKLSIFRGGRWPPGVSAFKIALTRVSRKTPPNLSIRECLLFWGFKDNEVTDGLFFLADNNERLFGGRVIAANVAKSWILNAANCCSGEADAGEELHDGNSSGEFQGVSLRYIPDSGHAAPFENDQDELDFVARIVTSIEEWLASACPPLEGHTRFLHGTNTRSMNSILEFGVDTSRSDLICDFGPGFYCTDSINMRTAVHFALMTAFENPEPGVHSCSVIYCDLQERRSGCA